MDFVNRPPLLEFRDVTVRFRQQTVLRDISWKLRQGETLAVIGESGCGKTVMLKNAIGLTRPTIGKVVFDGKNLAELTEAELTEQRLRYGFVFQLAGLFDSQTIEQNIAFPLRHHRPRMRRSEISELVQQRLADVGLSESVVHKRPAEISGGIRKRVGLARALMLEPEIVLYDEPTAGLDPIMSDVINQLILKTAKSHNVSSIVVTHDMNSVFKVADRVIMLNPISLLDPGQVQILFDGTPDELKACEDPRVRQFVRGEARERLIPLAAI